MLPSRSTHGSTSFRPHPVADCIVVDVAKSSGASSPTRDEPVIRATTRHPNTALPSARTSWSARATR